jgi:hypothetical protein
VRRRALRAARQARAGRLLPLPDLPARQRQRVRRECSRRADDPETCRIRLGTLDGDPGRRAFGHFWVSEKAPWFEITDDIPQHPKDTIS